MSWAHIHLRFEIFWDISTLSVFGRNILIWTRNRILYVQIVSNPASLARGSGLYSECGFKKILEILMTSLTSIIITKYIRLSLLWVSSCSEFINCYDIRQADVQHAKANIFLRSTVTFCFTMRNFIVCTVHLIESGWLRGDCKPYPHNVKLVNV